MIALVTGANVGLGLETVRKLAETGNYSTIIVGCRSNEKARVAVDAVAGSAAEVWVPTNPLDLGSLRSVRAFALEVVAELARRKVPLDLLVLNSGIMGIPTFSSSEDGFELHLAVNHLGHFCLTRDLAPSLADKARIVSVSSDAHRYVKKLYVEDLTRMTSASAFPFSSENEYDHTYAYGFSKLCNVWLATAVNERLFPTLESKHVLGFSVHPGVVQTEIARNMFWGFGSYVVPLLGVLKYISPNSPWVLKSVEDGVRTTMMCAADLHVRPKNQFAYYNDEREVRKASPLGSSISLARNAYDASVVAVDAALSSTSSL